MDANTLRLQDAIVAEVPIVNGRVVLLNHYVAIEGYYPEKKAVAMSDSQVIIVRDALNTWFPPDEMKQLKGSNERLVAAGRVVNAVRDFLAAAPSPTIQREFDVLAGVFAEYEALDNGKVK